MHIHVYIEVNHCGLFRLSYLHFMTSCVLKYSFSGKNYRIYIDNHFYTVRIGFTCGGVNLQVSDFEGFLSYQYKFLVVKAFDN